MPEEEIERLVKVQRSVQEKLGDIMRIAEVHFMTSQQRGYKAIAKISDEALLIIGGHTELMEENMAEKEVTRKLIKLIKNVDKTAQLLENTLKDVKNLVEPSKDKPEDDEGTSEQV
jgi:transcriptional regulator of heat shock response